VSKFRVTLGHRENEGGWMFLTREQAETWCEQFGNTFIITEVED